MDSATNLSQTKLEISSAGGGMRFLLGAIQPPTLHESTSERKATWMELFYDLAFVVAIATTAHSLSSSESPRGVLEFAVLFVLLQWAWTGYTFYNDRFDSDDLLHRLAGLCQMFLVLFIATLHDWLSDDFRSFVFAYIFLRLFTIAFNYFAGLKIPAARQTTRTLAFGYSIALVPLLAAIAVSDPNWRLALVTSAAVLQLVPPLLLPPNSTEDIPLSVSHIPERFGLFVTLTMGECFAGIVSIGTTDDRTIPFGLGCAIAIGIVFSIWWVYFARLNGEVLQNLGAKTRFWVYGHVPLTMSIVALAVGLEEQLESLLHPDEPARRTLLFLAWGMGLVCLAVIQTASHANERTRAERRLFTALLLFGAISAGLAFLPWDAEPLVNLAVVLVMGVILASLCIFCDLLSGSPHNDQTIG
ncbi:MAG: low temperature requirement protein A [Rubripirellula sp.]